MGEETGGPGPPVENAGGESSGNNITVVSNNLDIEQGVSSESRMFCIHCNSEEHPPVSKKCPVYNKQYQIKKIMAAENSSFKEAERIYDNPSCAKITTNNRYALLNNLDNFPELPSTANNNKIYVTKPKFRNTSIKQANPNKRKKTEIHKIIKS
nr:unnamed protein product [Callosobruchus chinensis]